MYCGLGVGYLWGMWLNVTENMVEVLVWVLPVGTFWYRSPRYRLDGALNN